MKRHRLKSVPSRHDGKNPPPNTHDGIDRSPVAQKSRDRGDSRRAFSLAVGWFVFISWAIISLILFLDWLWDAGWTG